LRREKKKSIDEKEEEEGKDIESGSRDV